MNNINQLRTYFPKSGTTETDKDLLPEVFLESNQFEKIMHVPKNTPRIVVGKKGSGKSAIVNYMHQILSTQSIPFLLLKPADIVVSYADQSTASIIRESKKALLRAIGVEIAQKNTNFVHGNDAAVLNQLAQDAGKLEPDVIQRALQVLNGFGKKISGIDFQALAHSFKSQETTRIKDAIKGELDDTTNIFYLVIDDTDQITSPSEPNHLNRIWGFILASREIMSDIPNVKCIITLRTEVWKRLEKDGRGQRDQIDHVREEVVKLNQSEENIRRIIEIRMRKACEQIKNPCNQTIYREFFQDIYVQIPGIKTKRYWSDYIPKRSRNPRDAIQLIGALAEQAYDEKVNKITSLHLSNIISEFAGNRVDDLEVEVEDECPKIKAIINSFVDCGFEKGYILDSDNMKKFLQTVPTRFNTMLFGKVLNGTDEDIFSLWKYLFEIGFLGARVTDKSQPDGYNHIDSSKLEITKENWNLIQKVKWQIHPAFMDYVAMKINDKRKLLGLKPL
ncbi:P-loop ATPase, Sll1717 family [Sulfuricurvum sp.]|uniref:P-loop ATPase, Sll1717 family n=1 Tax=Sulfuricurvum sp. TaxID=2025608 RepID=UPI002E32D65B|nr:hypothetical protein [Sulfuricurvum sp.]HEX5330042.1 hypothetical protein [Sulfuricurvum sp.]